MTDIQQWRRMIPRARTPAVDLEDLDGLLSPTTPRKGLKPKLSSYFTQNSAYVEPRSGLSIGSDLLSPQWPTPVELPLPVPEVENLIEAIMCRLLANPCERLDVRFNAILLQIFESFRALDDEKKHLMADVQEQRDRREAREREMQLSYQKWEREKTEFKAEVRRLELILANGKRGLAEVTLARQDSVLRSRRKYEDSSAMEDEAMETIFEFLEKTKRYEDKAWSSQRATMKRRSPSLQMRRLSRTLTKKASLTHIHNELPFGTPPSRLHGTLSAVKQPDYGQLEPESILQPGTNFSDDTLSTFSCEGDLLPDEAADLNLIAVAGTDNDFVAIKRIAQVLVKRREVDLDTVMPKLLHLFAAETMYQERSSSLPTGLGIQLPDSRPTTRGATQPPLPTAPIRKCTRSNTKASGFLSRLRPQLNIDTTAVSGRRFSFEPGDDTEAALSAPVMEPVPMIDSSHMLDCLPMDALPAAVRERLIRKSASMSFISDSSSMRAPAPTQLFPVAQSPSPTLSASPSDWQQSATDAGDGRRPPSRIPTPVYSSGSRARPRQEREDSASSLLTAIKHSEDASHRSGSISSSSFSSPPASRVDLTQGLQGPESGHGSIQRLSSSNRLLEHTNALRGSAYTVAAPKTADNATSSVDQGASTQCRTSIFPSEPRKENFRPITRTANADEDSNATL